MKKVFISQPMYGKTNEQICEERAEIVTKLNDAGYEVIDSIIEDDINNPIELLGESIKLLSKADYIYAMKGWVNSRGCIIEKTIANLYNIPNLDEDINL